MPVLWVCRRGAIRHPPGIPGPTRRTKPTPPPCPYSSAGRGAHCAAVCAAGNTTQCRRPACWRRRRQCRAPRWQGPGRRRGRQGQRARQWRGQRRWAAQGRACPARWWRSGRRWAAGCRHAKQAAAGRRCGGAARCNRYYCHTAPDAAPRCSVCSRWHRRRQAARIARARAEAEPRRQHQRRAPIRAWHHDSRGGSGHARWDGGRARRGPRWRLQRSQGQGQWRVGGAGA